MELNDDKQLVREAQDAAAAIYAVPQHATYTFAREDGWELHLDRYRYQQLTQPNEIRLLHLYPRQHAVELKDGYWIPRCELIHVSLDALPPAGYICLSYAWGDLRDYDPLLLGERQCLTVTTSLFAALQQLCGSWTDGTQLVWCDQVCINQHDLAERSQQIPLMGRIYESASSTVVWLGRDYNDTNCAYDLMQRLAIDELTVDNVYQFYVVKNGDSLRQKLEGLDIRCDESEPGWIELEKLSQRPWFSRLWTFQEFVTSRHVVFFCGSFSCTSYNLLRAFMMLQTLRSYDTVGMRNIRTLEVHRNKRLLGEGVDLLWLLQDTCDADYECSEPRDYVYALLSLQFPEMACDIHVDYSKPLSLVFTETARAVITSTKHLRILHRRRFRDLHNLPSWAPNWASQSEDTQIDDIYMRFCCDNGLVHIPEDSSPEVLVVRGKAIASISRVAAHQFSKSQIGRTGMSMRGFLGADTLIPQLMHELGDYRYRLGRYFNWHLAMVFSCGRVVNDSWEHFRVDDNDPGPTSSLADAIFRRSVDFLGGFSKCLGRKMAVLEAPDAVPLPVALVPDFARAGDQIFVVNGSATPLVLREVETGYEYIGECYVNGIMYGEAVDWTQEGGSRVCII